MAFLQNVYEKGIAENEKNLNFWDDYLQSLKSLDFSVYTDKLTVPVLVPIGSRIFFRGHLKHTNELTVALGAYYFTKCSLKQAETLRQHRIKDAESKLQTYKQEKEYLENQISFNRQNIFDNLGQEIIEICTEEEDKAWREKHRKNVRKSKQNKNKEEATEIFADEELWMRLEELELQEELENEMETFNETINNSVNNDDIASSNNERAQIITESYNHEMVNTNSLSELSPQTQIESTNTNNILKVKTNGSNKEYVLQQVIHIQNELKEKLFELKSAQRSQSKTEKDLIAKLDEMEQLDELEDEMDRLDDILDTEGVESSEEGDSTASATKLKRRVSFADEDDSETIEISFKHSKNEPNSEPYNSEVGIVKPSDIYEAHTNSFSETTTILKKSKYESSKVIKEISKKREAHVKEDNALEIDRPTIELKDVSEKENQNIKKSENNGRPMSLFKMRRQQKIK